MDMTVPEAALLLNTLEQTVYQWIQSGELPAHSVKGVYRLNRQEVLEWATAKNRRFSTGYFKQMAPQSRTTVLAAALQEGGLFYDVPGTTRDEVLSEIVQRMRLPERVDRAFLLDILLAREALGSTGVGNGIAIPHARNPIVLKVDKPHLALFFLKAPVDFKALDNKPVSILFTLISPTVQSHLQMLSRLAYLLQEEHFRTLLQQKALPEVLLEAVVEVDMKLTPATEGRAG